MSEAGNNTAGPESAGALAEAPAPAVGRVSEHYQGERGVKYVEQRLAGDDLSTHEMEFRFFAPYLKPSDVVLEFGCGTAGMLPFLAKATAGVTGLEVNPAAAERARRFGQAVVGSIDELGTEQRFDAIVSNHVLEHVRDVCGTLERLRRVLKPGGRLVMKLPIDDIRSRHQRRWSRDDPDHHLQTWTPRLFANVLFESGLDVRECRIVTHAWHPKLLPLAKIGLGRPAFWLLSVLKHRRQLLAVAEKSE